MLGHHTVAAIVDAYRKGLTDFDVPQAYAAMRKRLTEATSLPWRNGPLTELDHVYADKGFFPALRPGENETVPEVHPFEGRQAVAVTLECSYDAYAVALMARELGHQQDYLTFLERARNYRNLYNPANGFMAPRSADGEWIQPFDPKLSGGQGGRAYYAECNAWTYTWSVQHDVAGLIDLMGGREALWPASISSSSSPAATPSTTSWAVPRLDRSDWPVRHRQRAQFPHPLPLRLGRRALKTQRAASARSWTSGSTIPAGHLW